MFPYWGLGFFVFALVLCFASCHSTISRYASTSFDSKGLSEEELKHAELPVCVDKVPCCKDQRECKKMCDRMFENSPRQIKDKCHSFPRPVVDDLDNFFKILLKRPRGDELARVVVEDELFLILTLDYNILVDIIKDYSVDDAHQMLIWFARESFVADLLMKLRPEVRNEIMYELFSSAGDRTLPESVEKGLSQKVSFDKSFFEIAISSHNDQIMQITHDMMKQDLCYIHNSGDTDHELCMLRIYCKENINAASDGLYVHPETVRNEIVTRLEDEEFVNYIYEEVLQTGFGVSLLKPIMDDTVCYTVCQHSLAGCE